MKLRNIALGMSIFSVMVACNTEDISTSDFASLDEVTGEVSGISSNLEVKDYTDNITNDAQERGMSSSYSSNARTTGEGEEGMKGDKPKRGKGESGKRFHVRHYMDCADVTTTEEEDTKTVVIDFSNGACESKDGSTVSGKVTEVHTVTDSNVSHATTFEDFTENGKIVNGTASVNGTVTFEEGTTEEEGKKPKPVSGDFTKVVALTVFFPATDSTEAYTEQISRNINEELLDGQKTVTGSIAVESTVDGESFTTEITEPLLFNPKCGEGKPVFAPISGVEVMTKNGESMTINYGDGSCDFLVDITLADGTTETVDLKEAYDEYGFRGVASGKKKDGKKGGQKKGRK